MTTLTERQVERELSGVQRSAFRLEVQSAYSMDPDERDMFARFLAGDRVDPTTDPGFVDWFALIRGLVSAGRRVGRVRVHDDPPTDYQRFQQWVGQWNAGAGEDIRYLTRRRAREIGLPADDLREWWLLDDERLLVLSFDPDGHLTATEPSDDPDVVSRARALRDLAWRHAVSAERPRVA